VSLAGAAFLATQPYNHTVDLIIAIGCTFGLYSCALIGRVILDKNPVPNHAIRVTVFVHYFILVFLVTAFIKSVQVGNYWPLWWIPIPTPIGTVLSIFTGVMILVSILNLAQAGRGTPNPIGKLSQRLAVNKMFAWSRNPMIFSFTLFLISFGIWMQSLLFVLWVIVFLLPAFITMIKVYEERELEIRFGDSYLEYKSKTPMLFPRRPH
jgi:protein-S-isoprenylcysteine O-methyltransferase Ste14